MDKYLLIFLFYLVFKVFLTVLFFLLRVASTIETIVKHLERLFVLHNINSWHVIIRLNSNNSLYGDENSMPSKDNS